MSINTNLICTALPASLPLPLVECAGWFGSLNQPSEPPAISMPSLTTRTGWVLMHSMGWYLGPTGRELVPEVQEAWQAVTAEGAVAGLRRLGLDPGQWRACCVSLPWQPGQAA